MASNFLLNDQQNFTRMGVACVDEISLVLEDILKTQIAPRDLYSKICSCSELTKSSHSLRPDQKSVCFLSPPSVPDYSKFDVSLLYTLIRNLCQCLKPSQGWGENPSPTDTQIGDDIERLRLFRNEMFGHLPSSSVPDHEFMLQWKELEIISKRVQTFVRLQGHTTSCNYEEKLANIKRFEFGFKDKEKYEILLKGLQQLYIQTEDFPNITIRGESRILCGGKTCFVAEIENCLESSNFIVTWMKLKGKTTEHLDTNSEKFKGSTHLRLVIQRTLKEDEAEYQAIVQREVNGRHLNILSNKLTLQVFGDHPKMEILKVTSETEYLAIHYSCSEDVRPMIDQIQWTKDEIPLRLNSTKYNGGGVKDKYLKILSPAREDGGEYVYTIFNAWGSVRESITLGVPTAQLPQCLKIPFGSPVSIEPVIQSCPPVMKVVWEMSKDQNPENFKALDVTCSRYFGSTLDPQNPIFVIPKVSNADRMYYRIQVLNGIGNSWSNATLLKIHGDIPSVFINHETNFSERRVSLLCEIVLTKNSPGVETILWIKDKKPLDISGCGLKYSGGTVSDPTLTINAVNSNDSGEYQCNVSNAVGNMSSSPIYLGVPSIEIHSPGLEHDEEGEKLIFTCTVRSIPEATIVEWGIQQSPEDVFRKIDVHDPMYIGSTVSMPYPVLMVHKYYQTSSQIYLIKVTNYIGETTEVIQDQTHRRMDPCLNSKEDDARMKFYRNGALMVMFANLLDDLAELFPEYKLKRLKFLLRELMGKDTETMMEAESMREILQVLRQKNIFSPKDVLTMQYLLRKTECAELCNKCTDYAKKCKALCFFENQPENGYKQARFHVNGNVEDYSKEDLLRIRDTIAAMLDCSTDSVSIEGLRPSESFVVVVAIKQEYINRLLERAQNILVHLCDLNVDYFECDGVKIYRQEWEEAKNTGESTENSQHHPSGIQEQKERYTIPVQCVSDIDEYNLASPLEFSSLLPPGPSIAIEEIPFDDEKHVQEKQDMEETKEKLFESCKITTDNDENETALKIVCQNKTEIDSTIESASLEDKEVTLETYEDRMYQNELAEPAQRGKNCIIIAPTGSGKTIVAIKIIEHHLKANLGHKVKKIAFVVDKNNLAKQQADAIKRYIACKLKVISGDTMREEEFTQLSSLLPRYDIFVITAQMLVNAMDKKDLNVESFTLLIFDECHHCHGGHSFYKAMVPYHDEMQNGLGDFHQQKILPQIVGLTASIGVGNAKTTEQTVNHVKTMMANLDADVLVSVQINKEELAEKINRPYQSIVNIPSRKRDEFGASIQSLMIKTEDYFIKELENIVGENVVIPPAKKGNEQYTQWLQDDVKNLIANTKDKTLSRMLHTAWRYLQIYNEGLIMHSYLRARDSLDAIIQKTEELPKSSSELEQHIKFLFENEKSNLQVSATDNTTTKENPLLLKLKDIIIDTYQTEPNMRGIIFVRTRELADILVQWMSSIEELKHIKAKTCTGANAKRSEGGMTKNKQKETIDLFRKGDFKLIVATTIVEEGLDIKECNLVVKYDYAGNAIAQIQAKGRGRADKSRFFILASEDKCVAEREWINSEKEPMMDEAMTIVQMEILTNNEKFQKEKRELQQSAKIQREAAASNKERKETPSGQYELRCLKCKTILCLSSEMRKLKAHYACVNGDFKNLVFFERSEKVGYAGDDIQVGLGKLKCKECQEKLGVVALYKEVHFPILQIKSLKIENNQKKMFIPVVKKWKTVEEKYFTVPSISLDDLQKISKTGKLLNLD